MHGQSALEIRRAQLRARHAGIDASRMIPAALQSISRPWI
jgi:hypothetical protein